MMKFLDLAKNKFTILKTLANSLFIMCSLDDKLEGAGIEYKAVPMNEYGMPKRYNKQSYSAIYI